MAQQLKVLVIDDEKHIRQSFADYLEDCGYEVTLAENGKTGLNLMVSENPDLVLLDLRMPEMDGLELLQKGRKLSPDLPMIVISGVNRIGDVITALNNGAWDYLEKPVRDFSILGYAVETALEKARLIKENKDYQERLEKMVEERTWELKNANTHLSNINARLHKVVETTQGLTGCSDMKEFGLKVLNAFAKTMAASGGSLYMVEEQGLRLLHSLDSDHAAPFLPFSLVKNSIFNIVLTRSKPILIENIQKEQQIILGKWIGYSDGSLLAFPIQNSNGILIGIVTLHNKNNPPFVDQDKELGAILASYSCETIRAIKAFEKAKENEKRLRQSQKMEAIGTLAGGIAHDFNNILSGIIGYCQLAQMDIHNPDVALKNIDQIIKGAERATGLVKQILSFSRQGEPQMRPLKIYLIIKEAVKFLRSSIPSTIQIIEKINSKKMVIADATQIHQVVMNLCTNAYHAMRDTGGTLTISLQDIEFDKTGSPESVCDTEQYLLLGIEDTGCGIKEKDRERIFDPYFTTKEISRGTGLGLSVVNGIVKKHGGFIQVSTQVDIGTVFKVFLPVLDNPLEQTRESEPHISNFKGTEKIMFVEDEKYSLEPTQKILSNLGYVISDFSDSTMALEAFKNNPDHFDMVITDMTMPKMDGKDLSKEILQLRKDIPIILCTGFHDTFNEKAAVQMGIRQYLHKPISASQLAFFIRKELDKKNGTMAREKSRLIVDDELHIRQT